MNDQRAKRTHNRALAGESRFALSMPDFAGAPQRRFPAERGSSRHAPADVTELAIRSCKTRHTLTSQWRSR